MGYCLVPSPVPPTGGADYLDPSPSRIAQVGKSSHALEQSRLPYGELQKQLVEEARDIAEQEKQKQQRLSELRNDLEAAVKEQEARDEEGSDSLTKG